FELQNPDASRWRQPAVFDGPDEFAVVRRDGRLHRYRIVGRQSSERSQARWKCKYRRDDQGAELLVDSRSVRTETHFGWCLRSHDEQQYDRRYGMEIVA